MDMRNTMEIECSRFNNYLAVKVMVWGWRVKASRLEVPEKEEAEAGSEGDSKILSLCRQW